MRLSSVILEIEKVISSFSELLPSQEEFKERALPIIMKFTIGHMGPEQVIEYIETVYWNTYG